MKLFEEVKPVNPLLLDIPAQFETERLTIRAPRVGDEVAFNRAVSESIEELRVWLPWGQQAPSLDESKAEIARYITEWTVRSDLRWLHFDREGELVGGSGLHRIDWQVPRFEIGYWQRISYCGRGLVTEAVRGLTAFVFEELKAQRAEIRCAVGNTQSAAVARRAGYEVEATLRNWMRRPDGLLCDTLVFVRLPDVSR